MTDKIDDAIYALENVLKETMPDNRPDALAIMRRLNRSILKLRIHYMAMPRLSRVKKGQQPRNAFTPQEDALLLTCSKHGDLKRILRQLNDRNWETAYRRLQRLRRQQSMEAHIEQARN